MKSLVLLYRCKNEVTVREYPTIKEDRFYYIVGETCWRKEGILKKYVGEVCKFDGTSATCNGKYISKYPVEVPYMRNMYWSGGYFIFLNKEKYNANPSYYYDMIKNYREE